MSLPNSVLCDTLIAFDNTMLHHSITQHINLLLDELPSLQEGASEHGVLFTEYEEILHDIISMILSAELQLFSSHMARWTFLIQTYPQYTKAGILYGMFIRLKKNATIPDRLENARRICRSILLILTDSNAEITVEIPSHSEVDTQHDIALLRGTIQSWEQHNHHTIITCRDEFQRIFHVEIQDIHTSCHKLWHGAKMHFTHCIQSHDSDYYRSTESTLCIIEPDILYTATDIAECCGNGDHISIGSMFIRKFTKKQSGIALLAGIIVGNWLDAAISNEAIHPKDIINETIKSMPLQALSAIRDAMDMERLALLCQELIQSLDGILDTMDGDDISTETTFLAPTYGLMGRLDILMEYANDPLRKTVIELKSGNAPSIGLPVHLCGMMIPMGAWKNHVIQVACYNLLLDSAFPNRKGESRLLYAKDKQSPIRNVMNSHHAKREAIIIRNAIMSLEHDITKRKFGSFMHLFSDAELAEMPPFTREDINAFNHAFTAMDKLSTLYWLASLSFIMREHHSARIGSGNRNGLSSLWKYSIDEKQEQLSAIGYLTIDAEHSDFERFHIYVRYSEKSVTMTSLRKGDIVLLFPHDALKESGSIQGHMYKAIIKDIQQDGILISLRNKHAYKDHFLDATTQWCIETDGGNESLFSGILRSMGDFLRADEDKRALILGKRRPRKSEPYSGALPDFLHETQSKLLRNILTCEDYFLVQGPPGTGKTSALISTITTMLYEQSSENILLSAFTNRAVDELCAVVKKLGIPFLRLGSKQATAFPHESLQAYSEELSLEDLRSFLQSTRIIISTVSTLHTHPEIHDWFSATTMIIDEASQLLEPHISGILTHAKRYILIGDERQLPAVITQDMNATTVNHELFTEIGLTDFRMSLFERLLRQCIHNGDDHAFGMLTMQARMHTDISTIVSAMNYDDKLQIMNPWQSSNDDIPLPSFPRLAWIPTQPEYQFKVHKAEAALSIELALQAINIGNCDSIGIITPFRSQIALIQSLIPEYAQDVITVDTVERFQGSERDLIIISLAIHSVHHMKGIASIVEIQGEIIDRKLNVALTRARKQCIILGCPTALNHDSPYHTLWKKLRESHE